MKFIPIKTRVVNPPKDEIWDILDTLKIKDGDIVFITSKILAIHQGRCHHKDSVKKEDLIRQESTHWTPYENKGGFFVNLTITDNILIPSAGIDESNANNHYILWPKNTDALCREIREYLVKKHNIKNLGIISTDSHTMPLRLGVTGITTGLSGVMPLRDIRGENDIFGKELKITQVNLVDPITSMAVLIMGEAAETTPIVILRGHKHITFDANASMDNLKIAPDLDLYKPLLDNLAQNFI